MTVSPVISVVMATYNHAAYVAQAMESVLGQHSVDMEFLIADDGSTDDTAGIVGSFKDSRVRFRRHALNRGACVVTNELINQASGEFIAVINSDDAWLAPDKLAFQVNVLRSDTTLGATFGQARFIDGQGGAINKKTLPFGAVFEQENRQRGEWLRFFFEFGNCLCHPTLLIRRRCYEELGAYNNNLRQLPDFDMWIRLLKSYPIHVSKRELVSFRILRGRNASSQTAANSIRIMNEHYLVAASFFDGVDADTLKEGFAAELKQADIPSTVHLDIEKALLYFMPNKALGGAYKLTGILKLHHLLASEVHAEVLHSDYGIDARWLHEQTANVTVLRSRSMAILSTYAARLRTRIMQFTSSVS